MRIVITNERLSQRAGSDLPLRDLARGLQQLGHFVIAYSADPREQQRLLELDATAVATDLTRLPFRPDIIHTRHHFDAMTALVALPGVPAVHHCVGPAWSHLLPVHPRLHRYLAPSPSVARWIGETGGIPDNRIDVIPSAVDLSRFNRTRTAGAPTNRVLVYDDRALSHTPAVAAIRRAAEDLGFSVDFIGARFGRPVDNPEARLPEYDIVCATGRNAAEALACGCSVVAVDLEGNTGEVIDADNLASMRGSDFKPGKDSIPLTRDRVRAAFERLGRGPLQDMTVRARALLSLPPYVAAIEAAYRAAIQTQLGCQEDFDAEQRAASRYLHALSLILKALDEKGLGTFPAGSALRLLDASAKLATVQADLDKPQL